MKEEWYFDYPHSSAKRIVGKDFKRTIENRLVAWQLDKDYYDGKRENGYGGFKYDARWLDIIPEIAERYNLNSSSSVLEIGCKKGFFIYDMKKIFNGIDIKGIENHKYPIENSMEEVRNNIIFSDYQSLPFEDNKFDFILSFAAIYMLSLGEMIKGLKEIERVSKGNSYITVGAYDTQEDLELFKDWTLIGTTVLKKTEWLEVFEKAGYTGDYGFVSAKTLNLTRG